MDIDMYGAGGGDVYTSRREASGKHETNPADILISDFWPSEW